MEQDIKQEIVSIQLDNESTIPLYVQLYRHIKQMIEQGKLSTNFKMPPIRWMAEKLQINPGTVVRAYKELERNGFLISKWGSGSFVAEVPLYESEESDEQTAFAYQSTAFSEGMIDMSSVALDPDRFSAESFKRAVNRVLDASGGRAFTVEDDLGCYSLRESLALELSKRKIMTSPQNVQVISGAQQGIDICARAMIEPGDCVFAEDPTYPGALESLRASGAKIIGIPIDENGLRVDEFERKLEVFRPKLVYLMPIVQNPTGLSMSQKTKRKILGLAHFYDFYVIEDDYCSGILYDEVESAPLKAYDRDDRVIYIRSLSHMFVSGMRLGYLIMPSKLADSLKSVKRMTDIQTSGLIQRIFDYYLRSNLWNEHKTKLQDSYQHQFAVACRILDEKFRASFDWCLPSGGFCFWIRLKNGLSAKKVVEESRRRGLIISNGDAYYVYSKPDDHLRISIAQVSEEKMVEGFERLAEAIAEIS